MLIVIYVVKEEREKQLVNYKPAHAQIHDAPVDQANSSLHADDR